MRQNITIINVSSHSNLWLTINNNNFYVNNSINIIENNIPLLNTDIKLHKNNNLLLQVNNNYVNNNMKLQLLNRNVVSNTNKNNNNYDYIPIQESPVFNTSSFPLSTCTIM